MSLPKRPMIRRANDIVSTQVTIVFQMPSLVLVSDFTEPSADTTAVATTKSEVPAATTEKADVTDASENEKAEQAKPVEATPVAAVEATGVVAKAEAETVEVAAAPRETPVPSPEAASERPGGDRPVE